MSDPDLLIDPDDGMPVTQDRFRFYVQHVHDLALFVREGQSRQELELIPGTRFLRPGLRFKPTSSTDVVDCYDAIIWAIHRGAEDRPPRTKTAAAC